MPGTATLQQFDAVLLGGAAATQTLLDRARAAGVRLVTTYGMTETAGGCVYDGRPLDGVAVAVGADRLIRIGGPTVFSGYLGGDGDSPARHAEPPGWFRTSDLGRIDDDGLLQVEGRSDDVVVSGGVNVALPSVTRTLVEHPSVAEAVAVGVADEEWGTEVVAFVVSCRGCGRWHRCPVRRPTGRGPAPMGGRPVGTGACASSDRRRGRDPDAGERQAGPSAPGAARESAVSGWTGRVWPGRVHQRAGSDRVWSGRGQRDHESDTDIDFPRVAPQNPIGTEIL